jgi:apolipoprotein N-acyltransferase
LFVFQQPAKVKALNLSKLLKKSEGSESLLRQVTFAALTALLLLASFPPFSLSFFAWVALAPLLYLMTHAIGSWRSFLLGWFAGVVFTFFAENWIAHSMTAFGGFLTVVAYLVAFLFASILAIFPGLFALTMMHFTRRFGALGLVLAPFVWVATEWLRSVVTGVTWNQLGISQVRYFAVAKLAQYGGALLISWEVAAASTLIVLFIRYRDQNVRRLAAIVIFCMLLPALFPGAGTEFGEPSARTTAQSGFPVRVLGVQPHIPLGATDLDQTNARGIEALRSLTLDGVRDGGQPDLIVWAESPLALMVENDALTKERVVGIAREAGAQIIANTITRAGDWYFNSVHVVDANVGGASNPQYKRYDKVRLVPFGEYVPWRALLGRFVPTIVGDFTPGREAVVNTIRVEAERQGTAAVGTAATPQFQIERSTRFVREGAFICYEAAYPNLVRQFVNNGASLLINVSNDAWFGETAGPEQHLEHTIMRAIENNRDIVRVTNSGISALITADGRVVDQMPRGVAATRTWQATVRSSNRTFYTRHGDVFALVCVVVTSLAGVLCAGTLRNSD